MMTPAGGHVRGDAEIAAAELARTGGGQGQRLGGSPGVELAIDPVRRSEDEADQHGEEKNDLHKIPCL
jgi:hypothetical protein